MTDRYVTELNAPQLDVYCKILGWAFGFPVEDAPGWLQQGGTENVRGILKGAELAGGLLTLPMGQYFGGRRVAMVGIAGVAITPEARGAGAALSLMQHTARELHLRGTALSTLYPATLALYRKAGWELAGSLYDIQVEAARIGVQHRGATLRGLEPEDQPTVDALYATVARESDGFLDRSEYIWGRVRAPRKNTARGTLLLIEGQPAGYVFLTQKRLPNDYYDLRATDLRCTSPEAARALLSFVAQHATMASHVHWLGSAIDPVLWQMPERTYKISLREHWMTRICHIKNALCERGYHPHVSADLGVEVHDPVVPEQSGCYQLSVRDGRGQVERGGGGELRMDVRALAALYTGFASPHLLQRTGQLSGGADALTRAAAIFAGPAPTMPDFF
jgi:predicted acetyltransferase